MRLAGHLKKSLREVQALDSREITYWLAYDRVEGIPDLWAATANQTSAIVNSWGGKTKPEQFMPRPVRRPRRKQTIEQQQRGFRALAAAQAARRASDRPPT